MQFLTPLLALLFTGQSYPAIEIDPLLLVEAQEIWSIIGQRDNPVWPGWDARSTPILIYFPGKQDLLVNHPKPPVGFMPYRGPITSPIGPICVRNGKTILEFDGQNTSIDVNGVTTLVVADTLSTRRQWVESLAGAITSDPAKADETVANQLFLDPYNTMTTFAHEAFHVYQDKLAPDKGANELALAKYPSLSVENNVGFALESDFLAAALAAKTDADVRREAIKWLSVRQARRAVIGTEASAYEDGTEFSEGTAHYVEYRTLQALEGRNPTHEMWLVQGFRGYRDLSSERAGLIRQMQRTMDGSQIVNNDLYGASPVRFRLYSSGMGAGALLDRLHFEWHDRILKSDASLTDLAREAIHATPQELDAALSSIRSTQRFASLVAEKTALANAGKAYIANELVNFEKAPAELVIDYSQLPNPKPNLAFTPFGILRIDDERTMFRLVPIRGSVGTASFSEDGPRPVMQDQKAQTLRIELTGALEEKQIADQLRVPSLAGTLFEAKELRLPGVTVKNVHGRATLDGRRLVIQLHAY